MGKFDKVLVLTDFDGTFANDKGDITDDNKEMISYFTKNSGLFSVSTGRTFQGFHKYSAEYINAPVLLANGALAFDYEKKKMRCFNAFAGDSTITSLDIYYFFLWN